MTRTTIQCTNLTVSIAFSIPIITFYQAASVLNPRDLTDDDLEPSVAY